MFPQIPWLKIKISKNWDTVLGTDNNEINIFLSLKSPFTHLLAKEKAWKHIFNTNSELSQNRTEKQIMLSKTTVNLLFNDIWCYLVIASFEWKIGVFQQTVVRVYYILKAKSQFLKVSYVKIVLLTLLKVVHDVLNFLINK